jgi:hypothetical protein
MNYLVANGANSLGQGKVWWSPWVIKQLSWGIPSTCATTLSTNSTSEPWDTARFTECHHVEIGECWAGQSRQQQQPWESSCLDFLATQPPWFTEMTNQLEVNHWLHVTESKFGLLDCSEFQKTLYVAQQLCGSASSWWATYTATIQDNHHVLWDELCKAFLGHHLPAGTMHLNLWEFLDLQ